MAGINIHASDQASRLFAETALIPSCHPLAPASSSPPKFGTLIPNRIFVGGIPSNTTEQELKSFFSSFGQVKDVKIINDRLGISKGSYGFVTFESQEMAEKIIKNESETLIFKDRKLNIGYAIRKQQIFPRPDLTTALFFTGGAMPYGFQNSMAVFPLPGQEYSMLTQTAAPYATMMLPQPSGGTTLYLPPSLHSTATAPVSAYAHISQHAVTAALQQQFHQTGTPSGLTPAVVGQIAPVNVSTNNTSPQSQSTAAVMAAAAMAAAVQWPQQTPQNNQQSPQQLANVAVAQGIAQANNGHHTVGQTTTITQQQATAMAAAVAAQQQQQQQQATWRWSPNLQQTQNTVHGTSPQSGVCAITTSSSGIGVTASTPTTSNQNIQPNQQCPTNAAYLYSPLTGTSHEVMLFHHHTSSPYPGNSTSDYSTDHSTNSPGVLESVEPLSFQCDGTPIGCHTQQQQQFNGNQLTTNIYNSTPMDASCLSPYTTATFTPILEFHSHSNCLNQQNSIHPMIAASATAAQIQQNLRQNQLTQQANHHHQTNTTVVSIVNPPIQSPHHHNKIFTANATTCTRHLPNTIYANPSVSFVEIIF
uniref:RRM domain-containing protein n=1 Tax=Trichobilharzia regenti TaxID=157069 RepID=A0AA85J8G0_TRIRE|nr:unnamed protein product [Trichobilharzia regenti]